MRRRRTGFTLAEVVMAVSVTALIGLAAGGVAVALSNLNEHTGQCYQSLQTGRVASARLQDALRSARLVTASSSDALVLWTDDNNGDGQINLSELALIHWDTQTNQLLRWSVVFPAGMDPKTRAALDINVPLADVTNTDNVADAVHKYAQYACSRLLAADVQAFHCYCDQAGPITRLVKFDLTVGEDNVAMKIHGGARLRADKVGMVSEDGDGYFLDPPGGSGGGDDD